MMTLEKEKEYLYWLCNIPNLGAVKIRKLWQSLGSFEAIYNIEEKGLQQSEFLNKSDKQLILSYRQKLLYAVKEYHGLMQRGIQFFTPLDSTYPQRLRPLYDFPMGLYVKGRLPDEHTATVAIVGARGCTSYGMEAARYMARSLGEAGVQVISGLASGIDSAGHRGALEAGADTYGILGCGVDICYPSQNRWLYEQVMQAGGLISEYPVASPPRAQNFPVRNRLISGLSDVVLVMEARARSGSLITVSLALEQGKDVFALPGRITDPLSTGCNELIETGAFILTEPDQVLTYLGIKCKQTTKLSEKNGKGLAKQEKMLYSFLDLQPRHLEEIVNLTGLTVKECMSILLELEQKGFVTPSCGQYYEKRL